MKTFLRYFKDRLRPEPQQVFAQAEVLQAQPGEDSGADDHVRIISTDIGGKRYRIASDDDYLEHIGAVFEPNMVRLFDALVKPSDTVLDIGANIGCTTILFGSRARQVISFEPSPTTYKFLKRNVEAAELENVQLKNLGLGKSAGRFELTFSPNNRSGGFVSNKMQASAGHQVEAIDIVQGDAYMASSGIAAVDFIKIDVEGFERDVIEGLSQTIASARPIVTLELNHWCLNVLQRTSVPDFLDFLRSVFPYLYAVGAEDVCNLHDPSEAYHVMFRHVVGLDYQNIVGAFDPARLEAFHAGFKFRNAG